MCTITLHAEKRIEQRIGKKISKEVVDKAFQEGIKQSDVSGSVKRYLDSVYLHNRAINNMRIFHEKLFLFHNEILITVFNLPLKFKNIINKKYKNLT